MEDKVVLKRRLGLFSSVAFICGLVIGTGIWVSPRVVLEYTNSLGVSICIWAVWGVISIGMGLSYVELGMMFSESGGKYVYFEEAFGPFWGFLYIWGFLLVLRPGANALKALTFATYILKPAFPDCEIPNEAIILLAICLSMLLMFINIFNVKMSATAQTFCTSITFATLIIISVIGIIEIAKGNTEYWSNSFQDSTNNPGNIMLAFTTCYYAFGGLDVVNGVIEEIQDPQRTLPRALCISMVCISVLYLLANVAFGTVLGQEGILQSEAVAASFAIATFGGAAWLMPVFIGINTAGSYNSGLLLGSRLMFVGARKGYQPTIMNLVNLKYSSPIIIAALMFEVGAMASLLWLRHRKPEWPRPYKVPIAIPWALLVIIGIMSFVPIVTKPTSAAIGIGIILCTGVPYYALLVLWKPNMIANNPTYISFVTKIQKLLYCAKEDTHIQ